MTYMTYAAASVGCNDSMAEREIVVEHAALTRQLADAQQRVSEQLQADAQRMDALERQVMQLRAQLVLARSSLLWGLNTAGVMRSLSRSSRVVSAAAELAELAGASQVICQTGCSGHAHPWLEADGQCRRTGAACEVVAGHSEEKAG